MSPPRLQRTLARPASVTGRGYWTGSEVTVEFRPASAGAGVTFVRDDLVKKLDDPRIPVSVAFRQPASRRTVLRGPGGAEVAMIEHVVATLAGLGIDNCEVGVNAAEMPGCDGSAAPFVEAIDLAGILEQKAISDALVVNRPVRCGDRETWIEARPPMGPGLTIEYRLDYGPDSTIGRQWLVVQVDEDTFRYEIAPARTFLLESEAEAIRSQGLASHVATTELLVFRDEAASDDDCQPLGNTLRYSDECVRHKILDVIGDLALAGRPIIGHIVAYCSGHKLNGDLVEALVATHPDRLNRRRSA
jgi:UDP-3-O-acyl N-acetylglucosamine deacetylase